MDTDTAAPEEIFRDRVQAARGARGLSQRALAARVAELGLKINPTAITRIERGERRVSLNEVVAIATALDTHPLMLFHPEPAKAVRELHEAQMAELGIGVVYEPKKED